MKTIHRGFRGIAALVLLLLAGCNVPRITQQTALTLPAAYDTPADSATAAEIGWRSFFADERLIRLIDTALVHNWDVLSAFHRVQAARSELLSAKSMLRPSADAVTSTAIRRFGLYTMDGAGNSSTFIQPGKIVPADLPDFYIGVQSSWELDIWGKLRNRSKAAFSRVLASEEGKNWIVSGLVAELAGAYYSLTALDQSRQILAATIGLQEQALEMVRTQKAAAVINELAVKQFEAELKRIQGLHIQIGQEITETETRIRFLSGLYPGEVARDTSLFQGVIPKLVKTGVPADLLRNRPDIRQAELELVAAGADVQASRALFLPRLQLTAALGYQAFQPGLLFTTPASLAYTLLGNMTAPLLNRAAIKAQFRKADAYRLEAMYQYQKTVANGFSEVYIALARIRNLENQYKTKEQEVTILVQSAEIAGSLFRTGRATYLEVLFAQQKAIQARLELVELRKMQMLATVTLYKALGGGWR